MPAEFRIIEAGGTSDFRLEVADPELSGPRKLLRFRMTDYTAGKLLLANFPFPVVVDLSRMRILAKSRPILRDHDAGRIVGHTETIEINGSSIRLGGIVSGSNDHAREVSESGTTGSPAGLHQGQRPADSVRRPRGIGRGQDTFRSTSRNSIE